jgi:pimeloyl-ACP methyl ester carboxylesterase
VAPPAWTAVDWRPHIHDVEIRGRRLRYLDYGEGAAVLFVHGLGGSWQTWLENIEVLGAENRVLAVDLPGFGGSEPLEADAEIDDFADVLAALLNQLGVKRTVVAGHSLGGLVSCRLALDDPDRVRGLILINAGGVAIGPMRLAAIVRGFLVFNSLMRPGMFRAVVRRPRLRRAFLWGFVRNPGDMTVELASETIPRMSAPGFETAVRAGAKAAGNIGAERITVPTLLVWGRHDRVLTLEQARQLDAALPDSRLEVVDEAGHTPMFERPDEFNAAVGGFLRELALGQNP